MSLHIWNGFGELEISPKGRKTGDKWNKYHVNMCCDWESCFCKVVLFSDIWILPPFVRKKRQLSRHGTLQLFVSKFSDAPNSASQLLEAKHKSQNIQSASSGREEKIKAWKQLKWKMFYFYFICFCPRFCFHILLFNVSNNKWPSR